MHEQPSELCLIRQLLVHRTVHKKKDKCCKSFKDGKRCRKCPKR